MNAPEPVSCQTLLPLLPRMRPVDISIVVAQTSFLSAIKLCIQLAGLDSSKSLYIELGIDKGHWSRIMSGEAHFPVDKLSTLMDLCGNEAPLLWLVHVRGYDPRQLHKLESELERELRETQDLLAQEREKNQIISRFVKETRI